MVEWIKKFFIGKPLNNEALGEEKYGVLWGLPILSSDAISSVAYATEEILLILIPVIGVLAYKQVMTISAAIIILLFILMLSYRQTIESYPNGGGAYMVAKENLGVIAGVCAGSALSVDYILTVAVSISSGTASIISAFPALQKHAIAISLFILLVIMLGNLRGISESAKMFSIPAYAFMIAILAMLVYGLFKYKVLGIIPPQPNPTALSATGSITIFLLLKAFSSGCAAVTGVEAVSNAVPNFKTPSTKHAKTTLLILAILVFILFGGVSLLANIYHVVPVAGKTVLAQIAEEIFGKSIMYYYIIFTTMIILSMAANTAFTGFPMLVAVMAREGYLPRQLSQRGDRLSYSKGIIALSCIAALLIIIFKADTHLLIPLYAVGVFLSFTLSQFGMLRKWLKHKGQHWHYKAFINGLGAAVTCATVIIIGTTKFVYGAWIVVVIIPIMVTVTLRIKRHYDQLAEQLRIEVEDFPAIDFTHDIYRKNIVIVPIDSINKASVRALKYAKTISNNVIAFNISIDEEAEKKIKEKWRMLNTDIPLVVKYSPFRKIEEPLFKFIETFEIDHKHGDMVTIVLPQFMVKRRWHNVLHNHTRLFISNGLMKRKHIVIATMPFNLKN